MDESFEMREILAAELLEAPLHKSVIELLAPSWEQPEKTLSACVQDVEQALILLNDGVLAGFISWRTKCFEDAQSCQWALAYVGLGSVAETQKETGAGKLIVTEAIKRSHSYLRERYPFIPVERTWVWGTTGSPVAYYGLKKYSQDFIPQSVDVPLCNSLTSVLPFLHACLDSAPQEGHKLIARRSSSLRYTDQERRRLGHVNAGEFSRFGIDESEGDRLIMLMRPKLSHEPKG